MDKARFLTLAPREQVALLRALRDAGDEARIPDLVEPAGASRMVLDLLADALLSLGRPEEALRVVELRERQGVSSVSLGLRTRALAKLGRIDEALAALAGAGEIDPYLSAVLHGEALLAAGRADDARKALEPAVASHPYRRRGLLALAQACGAAGDWVTAGAFAARLEETDNDEEGPLAAKYLEALRAFHAATGGAHRLAELDQELATRRAEAAARVEALASGARSAVVPSRATPTTSRDGTTTRQRVPPGPRSSLPAVAPTEMPAAPALPEGALEAIPALVQRHFGFSTLRPGQAEVLARVLAGEDVLAVMPTGGGKSICYQLPGVVTPGVTLVVSPLLALMKDQLDGLPAPMRAAAVSITSELTGAQARRVIEEVAQGRYRLVYVAPERLRNAPLLRALRQAGVARLVVDEAHCVSVWGHDFRPDYLGIAEARRALGQPPILALTATAPPRVARDIQQRIGPLAAVVASIERPNLTFEAILAKDADEKLAHLLALCRETRGPGLVYVSSRAKAEQLATTLQQAGLLALAYHAGLPDRPQRQERFMSGDIDILVATVAFGMGVDKGDIRFVFHHDPSSSVENYYQEAGRAGRDGQPSRCVLLATSQDGGLLKQRARQDLPSAQLVDRAWTLLRETADENGYAIVEPEALRALDEDDVKPRVALSILAEAGAAQRLADVPRTLVLDGEEMGIFQAAQKVGVPVEEVESTLLARGASFGTGRRALLYRVLGDVSAVETVMARYAALAEQRAKEIMDYARTTHCRHAYLRRYFGEPAEDDGSCGACDNCLGITREAPAIPGADDEEARRLILDVLQSVRGIGETNLVWFLRGDARTADWIAGRQGFGALAVRSESKLKGLLRGLEGQGFLERQTLAHGGTSLRISQAGLDALHGGAALAPPAPAPAATREPASRAAAGDPLFEALRAWRRERAAADGVPPYVIAHDSVLAAIAAERPTTPAALQAVKGMGPKRVEKHGDEILRIVREGGGAPAG